jgi:hypothetical protein
MTTKVAVCKVSLHAVSLDHHRATHGGIGSASSLQPSVGIWAKWRIGNSTSDSADPLFAGPSSDLTSVTSAEFRQQTRTSMIDDDIEGSRIVASPYFTNESGVQVNSRLVPRTRIPSRSCSIESWELEPYRHVSYFASRGSTHSTHERASLLPS